MTLDPYAEIAAIYEIEFGDADADVAWFERQCTRGPTLVLGCGTGRISRVLAQDRPVTGLDLSAPMLAQARARDPHSRYVHGDMRTFDLGRFDQIVIPHATFNLLPSRADQAACLAAVRAALNPGGALWLDLAMPDARWLAQPHTPELPAWEGWVGDALVRRTREVHRRPVAQHIALVDRYYKHDLLFATSTLNLRLIHPDQAEWMLEACGLYAEALYGDYAGRPLHEDCPRLLVKAGVL